MNSFILKGDICYIDDNRLLKCVKNAFLVCKDNLCEGVFENLPEKYNDFKIVDYSNKLIIPGMIDLHIHAPQFTFRGTGMDYELIDWLNNVTFVEEGKYSNLKYADEKYQLFVDTLKKSATTRACIFATIFKESTILLMDKLENSGLITYVGKVNMDRNAPDFLIEKDINIAKEETIDWINHSLKKYQNTLPILTPRFIPTCSDEMMEQLSKIQERYNLPIQSHLSENPGEVLWVKNIKPNNKFYGDCYDEFNMFGKNNITSIDVKTIMAHCIYSTEEEINKMKENGVYIAHCPTSNLDLSSGIAPIRKYLNLGMNIGLGSDVGGGHNESIFNSIVDAIQVSKLYWRYFDKSLKPITFDDAFYMATLAGGSFFGKVGTFKKGYEFDALVIDDNKPYLSPIEDLHCRLERTIYMLLDKDSIIDKYIKGRKIKL